MQSMCNRADGVAAGNVAVDAGAAGDADGGAALSVTFSSSNLLGRPGVAHVPLFRQTVSVVPNPSLTLLEVEVTLGIALGVALDSLRSNRNSIKCC